MMIKQSIPSMIRVTSTLVACIALYAVTAKPAAAQVCNSTDVPMKLETASTYEVHFQDSPNDFTRVENHPFCLGASGNSLVFTVCDTRDASEQFTGFRRSDGYWSLRSGSKCVTRTERWFRNDGIGLAGCNENDDDQAFAFSPIGSNGAYSIKPKGTTNVGLTYVRSGGFRRDIPSRPHFANGLGSSGGRLYGWQLTVAPDQSRRGTRETTSECSSAAKDLQCHNLDATCARDDNFAEVCVGAPMSVEVRNEDLPRPPSGWRHSCYAGPETFDKKDGHCEAVHYLGTTYFAFNNFDNRVATGFAAYNSANQFIGLTEVRGARYTWELRTEQVGNAWYIKASGQSNRRVEVALDDLPSVSSQLRSHGGARSATSCVPLDESSDPHASNDNDLCQP